MVSEKIPGTEGDMGKHLFRELGMAFLELGPEHLDPRPAPVPVDPKLPPDFDSTANDRRPTSHLVWWDRPYVITSLAEDGTTRYNVRCLDGGAWDRSTSWGRFATLDEAIARAREPGPFPGMFPHGTWRPPAGG